MNQNSSSQSHWQAVEAAEKTLATDKLSAIGEWVAAIIVWVFVIGLALAIAGFMLGEK